MMDFGADSNQKSMNAIIIVLELTEKFAIVGRSFSMSTRNLVTIMSRSELDGRGGKCTVSYVFEA